MELFALAAAALVVLGAPALAAVSWRRSLGTSVDTVEVVAVAYGGVGATTLAIWCAAQLAGLSARAALTASLLIAAALGGSALMGRTRRASESPSENDVAFTGHHDGRVVPDAVAERRPPWRLPQPVRNPYFFALLGAGALFALLSAVPFLTFGLSRADGIHRMAMTDWYKHLVTGTSLASADLFPPANPFLHTVESAPYYYGFHLLGASLSGLAASATGDAPGALLFPALLLLTLSTALVTPFVAFVAARTVAQGMSGEPGDSRRVALPAALGATFLAGFDLIPLALDTAMNVMRGGALPLGLTGLRAAIPATHLDYWIHHNERQFNAPYLTTLWAPQHMAAALVALLVIHLVIQRQRAVEGRGEAPGGKGRLLPALLLAALPALSAYVAAGLLVGVAGALGIETVRQRRMPWQTHAWRLWSITGAAGLLLSLPVLALLAARSDAAGLTIQVSGAGGWVNGALLTAALGSTWYTGILDSVAVYTVELGIIGVLAAIEIRRMAVRDRWAPDQRHVIWMIASLMVFIVFVRPPVGGPNNLYARPLVLVWFLLAPFAALRWARWNGLLPMGGGRGGRSARGRRDDGVPVWAVGGVALCLLANAYALVGVLVEGALFWATPPSTVEVAAWVNDNAAPESVVAIAPDDFHSSFGYWLRRPLAVADERHALLFGATPEQYRRAAETLTAARGGDDGAAVGEALRQVGATLFLVARGGDDPPWRDDDCLTMRFENDDWLLVSLAPGPDCRP